MAIVEWSLLLYSPSGSKRELGISKFPNRLQEKEPEADQDASIAKRALWGTDSPVLTLRFSVWLHMLLCTGRTDECPKCLVATFANINK